MNIKTVSKGNFQYGMAGSYEYKSTFKDKIIDGTGYIEYLDINFYLFNIYKETHSYKFKIK